MLTLETIHRHIETAKAKYLAKHPEHTAAFAEALLDTRVGINTRCRTKAGFLAWSQVLRTACQFRLEISEYVHRNTSEEELYDTISHELAHLIQVKLAGSSDGHGPQWQSIHLAMGGNAKRCHVMKTTKRNARKRVKLERDGKVFFVTPRKYANNKNFLAAKGYRPLGLFKCIPTRMPDGKMVIIEEIIRTAGWI